MSVYYRTVDAAGGAGLGRIPPDPRRRHPDHHQRPTGEPHMTEPIPDPIRCDHPDRFCAACSQLAGFPIPWPCPDRAVVGGLIDDPSNRLVSECKWGQGDGLGRYCLTHEAWMRNTIGTQCPVGELTAEAEVLREREAQSLDVNALLGELAELRMRLSPESVGQLVQQANVVALDTLIEVMQESRGKFTTYDQAFGLVCAIRNAVAASGTALAGEIAGALDGDA